MRVRRRPRTIPGNPTVNFQGETRTNETHASTTDPDAQLYRKGLGKEAKLTYMGHVLLDNRHGLVTNVCATAATGKAEREAALLESLVMPLVKQRSSEGQQQAHETVGELAALGQALRAAFLRAALSDQL